jgi:hypothetical protein
MIGVDQSTLYKLLSTPFWEFLYNHIHVLLLCTSQQPPLSTPFWEFRPFFDLVCITVSWTAGVPFYSLLGVSPAGELALAEVWVPPFLLPFGSFMILQN